MTTVPPNRRLVFDHPAANVNEALPVGNGRLGAMVYGGVQADRLSLNDDRLWAGGTPPAPHADGPDSLARARDLFRRGERRAAQTLLEERFTTPFNEPYQPAGTLQFQWDRSGDYDDYERELDLTHAIVRTRSTAAGHTTRGEYFVSAPAQVVAARFTADSGTLPGLRLRLESLLRHRVTALGADLDLQGRAPIHVRWDGIDDLATPDNAITYDEDLPRHFAIRVRVTDTDGTVGVVDDGLVVRDATRIVVLVALATDARGPDPTAAARADLDAAQVTAFDALRAAHTADHRALFDRLSLRLPAPADAAATTDRRLADHHARRVDPDLMGLVADYGRYLLIASSRPGSLPANLQGVWNESLTPPWWDNYTLNINLQMNYWPAHRTGLHECAEPLADFIAALAAAGAATAAVQYGARGWVANHQTDIRLQTTPVGFLAQGIPTNAAKWALWPFGGAWLCLHLYEQGLYDGDLDALQRHLPIMQGAALFLLDWLIDDPDDPRLLATIPSTSPENTYVFGGQTIAISKSSTMDIAITRALWEACVAASALLTATGRPGADPAFLAEVAAALPRLPGTPVSTDGRILEFDADWPEGEAPHRHISHLFDLCPGEAITVDATPELAVAASRALDYRGDEGVGWSLAWKARCWARLHDAERSMALLHNLFSPVPSTVLEWADEGGGTYPNLLMCCPPFMIDANLGYTAALLELFVQDHAGLIDLLPACPTDLDRGDLDGLRLRGGLILDLSWSDGRVTRARLASPVAQERRIRVNGTVHEVALAAGDTDLSTIL